MQGRELSGADLDFIRDLLAEHPDWCRTRLSVELCERWNWRNAQGRIKDMAAYLTNNTRFLVLPWVVVPHLASHVLGLIARRIQVDWQLKYGHTVHVSKGFRRELCA